MSSNELPSQQPAGDSQVSFNISRTRLSGSGDASSTCRSTMQLNFMEKREIYNVIYEGLDLTPEDLTSPEFVMMEGVFIHAAFAQPRIREEKQESMRKREDSDDVKVFETTISPDNITIDQSMDTESGVTVYEMDADRPPSAFYLPLIKTATQYPPKILVVLKETETIELILLPAISYERGTPESVDVEAENENYNYITVGKGRNRKMITTETQTPPVIKQTRHALAPKPEKKNAMAFASLWDMYDTYERLKVEEEEEEEDEMVMYQRPSARLLRRKPPKHKQSKGIMSMDVMIKRPNFMTAVMLTQRVLSAGDYKEKQKKYRGMYPFDPLDLNLVYIYSLKQLWTYETDELVGHSIVTASMNPINKEIVAVAYGDFFYGKSSGGAICLWCCKNPKQPERFYRFKESVTAISFSPKNPNWLAAGFINGDVMIIDVTAFHVQIIAKTSRDTNRSFEAIWVVEWSEANGEEYIMTACEDGRINSFVSTSTHELLCTPLMRVTSIEGKMRGLQLMKPATAFDIPITRNPAVLCYMRHPTIDHAYYAGTDAGIIYKCSTNYHNQHIQAFMNHAGPIYDMQSSPFWKELIATCGADWAVRLWAVGIDEPLLTLNCPAAVYGLAWCPINSTLLVTVSKNILLIWDLRRKVFAPIAEFQFPPNILLTYVKFLPSGDSILLGDNNGCMYTYYIEDVPISAFYQLRLLEDSIRKALVTRPELLKELEKVYRFS